MTNVGVTNLMVEQPNIDTSWPPRTPGQPIPWFQECVRVTIFGPSGPSVTLPIFLLENIDVWVHEMTESYLWSIPPIICSECEGAGCHVCDGEGHITLGLPVQLLDEEDWATIAHIMTSLSCTSGNIKKWDEVLQPDDYSKLVKWRIDRKWKK